MNKSIGLLTTSLLLLLASNTASARLIDGEINFVGGATVDHTSTAINAIKFDPLITVNSSDDLVTGDFDGLESNVATFHDFTVTDPTPFSFWTVGGFTFTIASVTDNSIITINGLNIGVLGGNGTITSSNSALDETAGNWTITSNGSSERMSFSSTAVPAPAGAALLGLGLLGFGFARRNKKA